MPRSSCASRFLISRNLSSSFNVEVRFFSMFTFSRRVFLLVLSRETVHIVELLFFDMLQVWQRVLFSVDYRMLVRIFLHTLHWHFFPRSLSCHQEILLLFAVFRRIRLFHVYFSSGVGRRWGNKLYSSQRAWSYASIARGYWPLIFRTWSPS